MAGDFKLIDFGGLAAALLPYARTLVPQWLPLGVERAGRWYVGDFDGADGESANVNLDTGTWIDNGGTAADQGGDLLSLYKRVFGHHTMVDAARAVQRDMGWAQPDQSAAQFTARPVAQRQDDDAAHDAADAVPDVGSRPAGAGTGATGRTGRWKNIAPVPSFAPEPKEFVFGFKNKATGTWDEHTATQVWPYVFEGERFGYVARFDRIDSKGQPAKDVLQLTWCEDTQDPRGAQRWQWKHWAAPRPLYVPAGAMAANVRDVPVVVVEGEKCAQAGQRLLGDEFDFVTWPGGGKVWALARWGWVMGRTVYLWPDCDAQRVRLTPDEKASGVDPETKPCMPAQQQPGTAAMVGVGQHLVADHGCTVLMMPVGAPGSRAPGWDLADAVADGWDAAKVRDFIRAAVPFVPPDAAANAKAAAATSARPGAGAGSDDEAPAWRSKLLKTVSTGATIQCRENLVLALDGLPDAGLKGIPEVSGVIAFNELSNDVVKLRPAPWGTPAGVWAEVEDLLMGEWLVRQHWMPSSPRGTLEEAVRMVAHRHRFHPVREYLHSTVWDGTPRLATWLRTCCLEPTQWDDSDPLQRYLARVGTFFVMAMCARALTPGVKFDYMLILEGAQGMRKSTLLRTLAGEFFADTGLVLGDKDSYQQLQGIWLYEVPELDAFSKADVMKIKAYVASQEDYFRASYDRRPAKYPRQLVFAGTTNEDHYLTDPTGNRRFWPVRVTRLIDIDWLQQHRDQLFAEAMQRIAKGARMYPTPEEELALFVPQQQARAVENAIESAIARYLYPPDEPSASNEGLLVDQISLVHLLGKVGIGIEKLGPGRFHEKQAAAALRRMGWYEARSSAPGRPRVYRRPSSLPGGSDVISTHPTQGANNGASGDACPF